jgi:hypothetical protein
MLDLREIECEGPKIGSSVVFCGCSNDHLDSIKEARNFLTINCPRKLDAMKLVC